MTIEHEQILEALEDIQDSFLDTHKTLKEILKAINEQTAAIVCDDDECCCEEIDWEARAVKGQELLRDAHLEIENLRACIDAWEKWFKGVVSYFAFGGIQIGDKWYYVKEEVDREFKEVPHEEA